MKLPFRRNNSDNGNLPTEIKEYYQTERRERVGVAWLLALGTLLLTLVLATGLFFGGRWAYRKIAGNDKAPQTSQTQTSDQAGQSNDPQPTPTPTSPTTTEGPTGTSSTSTSTPSSSSTVASTSTAPASAASTLPNTGAAEAMGVFAAVSLAGTIAHSAFWSRRTSRQ